MERAFVKSFDVGEAPSPVSPSSGCPFHPRCAFAVEACRETVPALEPVGVAAGQPDPAAGQRAACIRVDEI